LRLSPDGSGWQGPLDAAPLACTSFCARPRIARASPACWSRLLVRARCPRAPAPPFRVFPWIHQPPPNRPRPLVVTSPCQRPGLVPSCRSSSGPRLLSLRLNRRHNPFGPPRAGWRLFARFLPSWTACLTPTARPGFLPCVPRQAASGAVECFGKRANHPGPAPASPTFSAAGQRLVPPRPSPPYPDRGPNPGGGKERLA